MPQRLQKIAKLGIFRTLERGFDVRLRLARAEGLLLQRQLRVFVSLPLLEDLSRCQASQVRRATINGTAS